jgi:tight adherence protein B
VAATAERAIDLLMINAVWPRALPALRVLSNGIGAAVLSGVVLYWLLNMPWGLSLVVAVGALGAVPFAMVNAEQNRQARAFEAMLADTIEMMVRMLRAGMPVTVAVERVASEAQQPAARVYREAAEWLNMGMPLPQAMRTVAARIKIKDFDFFSAALSIQNTVGGNLTETLVSLAAIIRERNVSILKARAITSQARMTANVILGILPTILVAMQLFQPDYLTPLTDGSHGYGMIVFIFSSYFLALITIRRLVSRVRIS